MWGRAHATSAVRSMPDMRGALVGGVLGRTGVRRQAHGQMSSVGANSTGVLQIRSDVSDARSRAPRVLRAVQAHTPTSRQSGDVNSNMLFTASAVRSTCGSGGSPHAGSKNDRQRQYRSDRSETAVRAVGRDPGAAHVFHEPYLHYSTTTITSVEGRECAMVPRNPPRPTLTPTTGGA